jgi:hypothetical protein
MFERGIDAQALATYARRMHSLTEDHAHGRLLRRLCRTGMEFGVVDELIELARTNRDLYALLYDIISGRRSYRLITHELLRFALLRKVSVLALRRALRPVGW